MINPEFGLDSGGKPMEPGTAAVGGMVLLKKMAVLPLFVMMVGKTVQAGYGKLGETVIGAFVGAIVMAAISAAGATYVLTRQLETKVEALQTSMSKLETRIEEMHGDLYSPYKPDGHRWTK